MGITARQIQLARLANDGCGCGCGCGGGYGSVEVGG